MEDNTIDVWTKIIKPKKAIGINFKEIYRFKDLLLLFVKRDFISIYKQTILGPLWFFIQPLLTTLMFSVVFNRIAGISTEGAPQILFYLSGLAFWNYFADTLNNTSETFIKNQDIFGKVYFPRLITPLSIVVSSLFKFLIQFVLFGGFYFYYYYFTKADLSFNLHALLLPFLIVLTGVLGLAFGLIITSMTTKYRDLRFVVQFGVQLWMYATPIIYPLSTLDKEMRFLALLNPMTSIIETFKYGFLGIGTFSWGALIYSTIFGFVLLFLSVLFFNKTEQNFMDTI